MKIIKQSILFKAPKELIKINAMTIIDNIAESTNCVSESADEKTIALAAEKLLKEYQ